MPEWARTLLEIGAILLVAAILSQITILLIRRFTRRVEAAEGPPTQVLRRAQTLASVMRSGFLALIWTIALISCLGQAGVAVGPILAAAGIVGVALGFGAQNLVRDLLGGFFILLEA